MKALWNWQRTLRFNRARPAGKQRHSDNFPADTPCQYWKMVMYLLPTIHGRYIIHGPLAARKYGNEHTTVSLKIATWLSMYIIRKQLVHAHKKEYSSCTKCSKTTCLDICGNYKTKLVAGKQDGKRWMSLGDQTPSIKSFKKSISTYTPTCTVQSALSAQWKASQELSALYNDKLHVGTGFDARP